MKTLDGWVASDDPRAAAVAIGFFDGVHLGHRALITRIVEAARTENLRSVVLTFDRHPLEVLAPDRAPLLLSPPQQRSALLAGLGVDELQVLPFDQSLRDMSAADFVRRALVELLRAGIVVVGEGFVFGRARSGDTQTLTEAGARLGFRTDVVAPIMVAGLPASSSRARALVGEGDMPGASRVLGRPYRLTAPVVRGDQIGRTLGYPTANLATDPRQLLPPDGVYASVVEARAGRYAGALSIGFRPTIGGIARITEVYLDGFSGDLYGSLLTVECVTRLRRQVRFPDLAALKDQIALDVAETRAVIGTYAPQH